MGWDRHGGKGLYYTRSYRVDGRVVRKYLGTGAAGVAAEQAHNQEKEERQLKLESARKERQRHHDIEMELRLLATLSNLSMKEELARAGYHAHKGEWRRQRGSEVKAVGEELQLVPRASQALAKQQKDISTILEAVEKRRPGSLVALDQLVKEQPWVTIAGDVTRMAEERLLKAFVSEETLTLELVRAWLAETRRKLAEPGDGELELQLIHRISLNLLAVSAAESRRAAAGQGSQTWKGVEDWDRHVSRLQNDFLRATRALADARRLRRPVVLAQMNIADKQQINVTATPQMIEAAAEETPEG